MFQLELSSEEQTVLAEILTNELADIGAELAETEKHEYKQMLHHRGEVVRKLLKTLDETQGQGAKSC
jgi:hypothetical protein